MLKRSLLRVLVLANLSGVAVAFLIAFILSLDHPGGLLALTRAEIASAGVGGFSVVVTVALFITRGLQTRR